MPTLPLDPGGALLGDARSPAARAGGEAVPVRQLQISVREGDGVNDVRELIYGIWRFKRACGL